MENSYENKGIRGITLVALVISIIVLLIFAGVSTNMLKGDNGMISKVESVDKLSVTEKEREMIILMGDAALIEGRGEVTYTNLVAELNTEYTKSSATNADNLQIGEYIISPEGPATEWTITLMTKKGPVTEKITGGNPN